MITLKEFEKKMYELKDFSFNRTNYLVDKEKKELNCAALVSYFFEEFDNLISYDKIINNKEYELIEIEKKDFCIVLISTEDDKNFNHTGIFLKNQIIHISKNKGILAQNYKVLEKMFKNVKYFAIKNKKNGELLYV